MAVFVCSCGNTQKKTSGNADNQTVAASDAQTDVTFAPLENYFLKNTVSLPNNVNVLTANNADAFNNLLGVAKTMTNKVVEPDFAKNSVVVVAYQSTNVATTITVDRIALDKNGVNVYVKTQKGETQSYSSTPVAILTLPKQTEGTVVNVFEGENKLASGTL